MKAKVYFRCFRSVNGLGLTLFRSDRLEPWRPYFVLSVRPRQRRILLRLQHSVVGFSWWPPRLWSAAVLLAEKADAA